MARSDQKISAPVGSHEANIIWVMQMISSPQRRERANEIDAPTLEAWALFQEYSGSAKSRQKFMETFYNPFSKKEKPVEKSGGVSDDQRRFFKLFELLQLEKPELLHGRANPVVAGSAQVSRDCRPSSIVAGTCAVAASDAATAKA